MRVGRWAGENILICLSLSMGTYSLGESCTTTDRPSSKNCRVGCIVEMVIYFEAISAMV